MLEKKCFFTQVLRQKYPEFGAVFSIVEDSGNLKADTRDYLNNRKSKTEDYARTNLSALLKNTQGMAGFFKSLDAPGYHISSLIKAIARGRPLKLVNPLVDLVQFTEIENSILMGLNDLDCIKGDVIFDVLEEPREMRSLFNNDLLLEKGDIVLCDDQKIFASISKGPDNFTRVTPDTCSAIIFAFYYPSSETKRASEALKTCTTEMENVLGACVSCVKKPEIL